MSQGVGARFAAFSVLWGMVFGAGWWVFIDGYASCMSADTSCDAARATRGYAWLPLLGATLSFIMVNGMRWSELRDDVADASTTAKARIFLIFALLIDIAVLAGSGFIVSDRFLQVREAHMRCLAPGCCARGSACIAHAGVIGDGLARCLRVPRHTAHHLSGVRHAVHDTATDQLGVRCPGACPCAGG